MPEKVTKEEYKKAILEKYKKCAKCNSTDLWLYHVLKKKLYTEREMYGFHINGYKKTPYVVAMCRKHLTEEMLKN